MENNRCGFLSNKTHKRFVNGLFDSFQPSGTSVKLSWVFRSFFFIFASSGSEQSGEIRIRAATLHKYISTRGASAIIKKLLNVAVL